MDQISERRRYNEEIEYAFLQTVNAVNAYDTYMQVGRNNTLIGLYERFFSSFNYLIKLTGSLQSMRKSPKLIIEALDWAEQRVNIDQDTDILKRMNAGKVLFKKYSDALSDLGLVSLPSVSR